MRPAGPYFSPAGNPLKISAIAALRRLPSAVAGVSKDAGRFSGLISWCLAGRVLARFDADGKIIPTTPVHRTWTHHCSSVVSNSHPRCSRRRFRWQLNRSRGQFDSLCACLRILAIANTVSAAAKAHPSVDGMKTGRGYSGSTPGIPAAPRESTSPPSDSGRSEGPTPTFVF